MDAVFPNTTLGKGLKTLWWIVVSAGLVAGLSFVTNHPEIFSPLWIGGANILLVVVKNYFDPKIKNF